MDSKIAIMRTLRDVLVGFAGFGLTMAAILVARRDNDSRAFAIATAVAFLLAGMARSASESRNPFLKAFLVSAGGWIPVAIMAAVGMGFTDRPILVIFLCVSFVFAICGLQAGTWIRAGRPSTGIITVAVSLGVALALSGLLLPRLVGMFRRNEMTKPVPPFSFSTPDGRTIHDGDLRGQVVVLAFWATWCTPCRAELPKVAEAYARYRSNPQVKFWAVDIGSADESMEKATAFLAQKGWNLPCALSNETTNRVLGVSGIPKLIILDQNGQIRVIHDGYDGAEPLVTGISQDIDRLLQPSK